MSSIKCPVCGKEVSPFTRIHCGRPLSASQPAPLNPTAADQVDIGNKTPTSNSSVSHSASSFFVNGPTIYIILSPCVPFEMSFLQVCCMIVMTDEGSPSSYPFRITE